MAAKKASRPKARRSRPRPAASRRKASARRAARRPLKTRRPARKTARPRRKTARGSARKARTAARRKPVARRKTAPRATKRPPAKVAAPRRKAPAVQAAPKAPAPSPRPKTRAATAPPHPAPALDRARRQLPVEERFDEGPDERMLSSVRAGSEELQHRLTEHTESGPSLTAGDVDARWDDAYAVGDEAPGGDNPTPDQDRVDDIGRALGVNYDEGEELKGSEKIADRDKHRWELDPASSDDWPHDR